MSLLSWSRGGLVNGWSRATHTHSVCVRDAPEWMEDPAVHMYTAVRQLMEAFTKPPLLQESRLTGGGSPNLMVLVEWKVPVEGFMGAANCFH